mmetsp:Transcript_16712/g.47598  ORF Transcript_16712/g.47598 Transcript_16712/m.47598 type:complete len:88 (+) Transcript_16712:1747-2010(+)
MAAYADALSLSAACLPACRVLYRQMCPSLRVCGYLTCPTRPSIIDSSIHIGSGHVCVIMSGSPTEVRYTHTQTNTPAPPPRQEQTEA